MKGKLKLGFESSSLRIPIDKIVPLRAVADHVRKSVKYAQIAASIREVGIIEPPVVVRDAGEPDIFHLLDGHLRVEILKEQGVGAVVCLISTDDEAYTYNKRINRLAIIQEHRMILTAIEKGVSEERLARALNLNIASVRSRRRLLEGIAPDVAELLRDKHVPLNAFRELRRMLPERQLEAAQLMVAMNRYTLSYAKSLVAATPDRLLAHKRKKTISGLTDDQIALMQEESEKLQLNFKAIERDYGADHLDLVLALGYVGRLLGNARVVGYLAQCHPEILSEFQKLAESQIAA
ncbi:chromosome partitioning protein ParB [Sphingomonas parva]|uniref:Chromosome partitioning protein ParB n=1 Tax=Sphingomonas parva TaxID=2555898 RepID=A0A4Y8ZPX2_9SPHN|nr:plasmid partitioning protein RepB C-terminal domain-containing protein [Sphingomonas parva]TFI57507.1 chromosome partitioning protein ParB [Sphingomonas parva]